MKRDKTETPPPVSGLERDVEALLFASDAPLSASRLSALTGETPPGEIREAVRALERWYRGTSRSFGIVEVAGGYQLTTLPEYARIVGGLFRARRKMRLSQPALETLAIIAYKQPISRMQIEAIRGVNCDGVVSTLVDRELITITGRGEGVGRPFLYSTTRKFLEYLGLKDFRDLPALEELEKEIEGIALIPDPAEEDAGETPPDASGDAGTAADVPSEEEGADASGDADAAADVPSEEEEADASGDADAAADVPSEEEGADASGRVAEDGPAPDRIDERPAGKEASSDAAHEGGRAAESKRE